MFKRTIETSLKEWKQRKDRKVLVLRGARQVGKTTAVRHFGQNFGAFLYFNLEIPEERDLFEHAQSFDDLTAAMFLFKNIARSDASVLILLMRSSVHRRPSDGCGIFTNTRRGGTWSPRGVFA